MSRSESKSDWRSWLALGWAVFFGCLYVGMVLRERAPGIWQRYFAG